MHILIILILLAVLCRVLGAFWTLMAGAAGLLYIAFIFWHMVTYSL
jgi:hypothetical protein